MDAAVGRMGGGSQAPRMGPPPSRTQEELRAEANRNFGPVGDDAAVPSEPPQQINPVVEGQVSPGPVPPAGPFLYIDMNTFTVVTRDEERFPIKDMDAQKGLMILCRNTQWSATTDKFVKMSETYGLPLPQVGQQETSDGQTPLPEVSPVETSKKVRGKTKKLSKVSPAQSPKAE